MTQVFFYHNAADRIAAMAALIGKAYRQRKPVLVYAPEAPVAGALDRQLWLQPPTGFIPHVSSSSPLADETPVIISGDPDSARQHERLINLSEEVPPGFSRFASLIEVVGQEANERQSARTRVKFYKDRGYAIQYFDLAEKPA